jgi:hypothetical protein
MSISLSTDRKVKYVDYIKFINEASFDEISYEISRLAKDTSKDAIENISLFLTHRIGDTFGKHEIPRLACRALIHKGKKGIEKMMSLLYEIKGFIYPTAIINSLWYAQNGELDPFPSGGIHIYPPLDSPPSPEVICRFVKHIGQYGNVKIQKETTNEEDASAYY